MVLNYTFLLQANFIDLDVKPLDKMEHYFKLDQKIVNFYSRNEELVPSLKGSNTKDDSQIQLQQWGASSYIRLEKGEGPAHYRVAIAICWRCCCDFMSTKEVLFVIAAVTLLVHTLWIVTANLQRCSMLVENLRWLNCLPWQPLTVTSQLKWGLKFPSQVTIFPSVMCPNFLLLKCLVILSSSHALVLDKANIS